MIDGVASFSHWLKQRRKALDLTQQELARLVGCAVVTIQKIEEGQRRPSRHIAERLAEHLAIPVAERGSFLSLARTSTQVHHTLPAVLPADFTINLPTPLTSLIGRANDIVLVKERLSHADVRLLTLIGPPGVGKTRLCLGVASELGTQFPDGIWFVALAAIRDPQLVAPTIAHALGLTEAGTQPTLERLKRMLRTKRSLLVLDNLEQIVATAPLITELLAACSQLKVLITSRMPLHVYGEYEFAVEPLPVPTRTSRISLERLRESAAIQLFIARVQAFKPDFALTVEHAPAIIEICTRLDGLPLAIELAAARMRQFTPESFIVHLNRHGANPFSLLSAGPHDMPARQQTLHNALTWSYELLGSTAQHLFRRMGVFVGGSSVAAVLAVCNDAHPEDLTTLIDQNLVRQELAGQAQPRVIMLEMIREYALVQLEELGEREPIEQAHTAYFLALAEDTHDQAIWLNRMAITRWDGLASWLDLMEADHDNMRAALRWALASDPANTGLRLCRALWWFWEAHGHWSEGLRWSEGMLEAAADSSPYLRMQVLSCIGPLAWKQGDYARVTDVLTESLRLSQQFGATLTAAYALLLLGQIALEQGNYTHAGNMLRESLAVKQTAGDPAPEVLMHLGQLALVQEEYRQAEQLAEECLRACQQVGDRFYPALALRVLGETALAMGQHERARTLLRESVLHGHAIRHQRVITFALIDLARAMASDHEPHPDAVCRAAQIWGATEAVREEIGIFLPAAETMRYQRAIAQAQTVVTPERWAIAWAQGRKLTLEQAIEAALKAH
jgi:predicted ATPase/DNA-binding XRE family transcriptional regulator/predicted negative regulator of RcsB-dependent stress response